MRPLQLSHYTHFIPEVRTLKTLALYTFYSQGPDPRNSCIIHVLFPRSRPSQLSHYTLFIPGVWTLATLTLYTFYSRGKEPCNSRIIHVLFPWSIAILALLPFSLGGVSGLGHNIKIIPPLCHYVMHLTIIATLYHTIIPISKRSVLTF